MDSRKVGAGAGENLQKRDEVIEMEIKKQEQTARKRLGILRKTCTAREPVENRVDKLRDRS